MYGQYVVIVNHLTVTRVHVTHVISYEADQRIYFNLIDANYISISA